MANATKTDIRPFVRLVAGFSPRRYIFGIKRSCLIGLLNFAIKIK